MIFDSVFMVALQSSLLLGLIHGINPCGHSWLVLAPFVYGERNGKRVFSLTAAFIIGTSLACLGIGLTLGAISMALPPEIKAITDMVTAGVLVILGLVLVIKPEILHSHDHDHNHEHDHDHEHEHEHGYEHGDSHKHNHQHSHSHAEEHSHNGCCSQQSHHHDHDHSSQCDCTRHAHKTIHQTDKSVSTDDHHKHKHEHHHSHGHGCGCSHGPKLRKATFWGLLTFGFVNMIVPCPTVAIMYQYALDSADVFKATSVFASYALGTAIALAVVIYAIYKIANAMRALDRPWLEPLIMRVAGVMTIGFGIYSYLADAGAL